MSYVVGMHKGKMLWMWGDGMCVCVCGGDHDQDNDRYSILAITHWITWRFVCVRGLCCHVNSTTWIWLNTKIARICSRVENQQQQREKKSNNVILFSAAMCFTCFIYVCKRVQGAHILSAQRPVWSGATREHNTKEKNVSIKIKITMWKAC